MVLLLNSTTTQWAVCTAAGGGGGGAQPLCAHVCEVFMYVGAGDCLLHSFLLLLLLLLLLLRVCRWRLRRQWRPHWWRHCCWRCRYHGQLLLLLLSLSLSAAAHLGCRGCTPLLCRPEASV
jgi:hypothetical protein